MAKRFYNILWKFVIAFHSAAGYGSPFGSSGEIFFPERFFVGGTDTVRGYDERRLSPYDSNKDVAMGGYFMHYDNLELRFPIVGPLLAVLFADAGKAWDKPEYAKFGDLSTSAGIGLRFTIPQTIMMIRLDYGYGFDEKYMVKDGKTAPRAVPLLLVAWDLERICDLATAIAEDVIYMIQAKIVKHHPEKLQDNGG